MGVSKAEIESQTKGDKKYELENLLNESSSDDEAAKQSDPDENGSDDEHEIEELADWVDDLEGQT